MIEYLLKRVGDRVFGHNQTGEVVCSEVTFSEIADVVNFGLLLNIW